MKNISLLIKPVSGSCNMRCKYCFYEDEMSHREIKNYGRMSYDVLEALVRRVFHEASGTINFMFQGGEPTLIGLDFYKTCIDLVRKYNKNNDVVNFSIQTNGLLINDEWADFFHKHKFLVGISLDGNEESHDCNRLDLEGKGTYSRVMKAIEVLKKHQVEFNIVTVIQGKVAENISAIYNLYKRNHFMYQQYIECLEPFTEDDAKPIWLDNKEYATFLIKLFRKWSSDIKKGNYVYNRYFENLIMILKGYCPESCGMMGRCGIQWVIEADGSVFPCDFYVLDPYKLGNIMDHSFKEMEKVRIDSGFIQFSETILDECKRCKWFMLCRNGCRRNCEPSIHNRRQKNRFCSAYKEFYENVYEELVELAKSI